MESKSPFSAPDFQLIPMQVNSMYSPLRLLVVAASANRTSFPIRQMTSTATRAVSIVIFGFVAAATVTADNPALFTGPQVKLQHSSCALKLCRASIANYVAFRCSSCPAVQRLLHWIIRAAGPTRSYVVILIKLRLQQHRQVLAPFVVAFCARGRIIRNSLRCLPVTHNEEHGLHSGILIEAQEHTQTHTQKLYRMLHHSPELHSLCHAHFCANICETAPNTLIN